MANITAARINNLQNRISLIYGQGAGQSGYGQTLSSSQVSSVEGEVRAADLNNIYADILNARVHQVGVGNLSIDTVISGSNTVAEETSAFLSDDGILTDDPDGFKKGIADYEALMTLIETNKFIVSPSQAEQSLELTDIRTASWNGLIYQLFTVTFNDLDHRRNFFNSGGQIRIAAANSAAKTQKGLDWAQLLAEVGTVSFGYNNTVVNSVQVSSVGNYDLTTAYQQIYYKAGTGYTSAVYENNTFKINARELTDRKIEFRIEFDDTVFDNVVDNNVDGRLESNAQLYIAKGNYVSVEDPTFSITTSVSGFDSPAEINKSPEYSIGIDLARNQYEIQNANGQQYSSVDYTVQAVNVDYPITLYWDTQVVSGNVTAADFDDNTLSGSITITAAYTQSERTINRTLLADNFTEGNESFRLRLYTDSSLSSFVDSTGVVTIIDNSVGVTPAPTPTYSITSEQSSITEGNSSTYTVSTSNVPNGTLYWTTTGSGITAGDFTDNTLSGTVEIFGGTGQFIRTTRSDATTEGTEVFDIQLRTGSISGTVVLTASNGAATSILDTSLTPPPVTFLSNSGTSATATTPGIYKWTAPSHINSVTVSAVGAGGSGYSNGGAGGGGGGYGHSQVAVIPGQTYDVLVGAGAPNSAGGNTYFKTLNTVSGRGGSQGSYVSNNTVLSPGAAGGGFVGNVTGGNGGAGGAGYWTYGGGGGGGAGGHSGDGGTGGTGGRSVSGISATNGTAGAGGAGGGGGGGGSVSPSYGAGGGGGVIAGNVTAALSGFNGTFGTANGATGTGGGGGMKGASGISGSSSAGGAGGNYGGGGGASGGSGGGAVSGGNGAITLAWDAVPPPTPTIVPAISTSSSNLQFTSPSGVSPSPQRIIFTSNAAVTVTGISVSQGSSSATSIDYTGALGVPSGVANFSVTPSSSKYIDVTFYRFGSSGTSTLTISTTAGTKVVQLNWTAEVVQTPTYSMTIDTGHPRYPQSIGDETQYNVFTYTVTTTNVPNGTVLYWTTNTTTSSGRPITVNDVNGFTGTVTINNNSGSFTRTAVADSTTESGTEFFGTEIRTGSITGPVKVSGTYAAIQDTSLTPAQPVPQYNPQLSAPTEVTRGETFSYSFSGGAPGTTWVATNGVIEFTGTFDSSGNFSGNTVITSAGSYDYVITYSDPTSTNDTFTIICVDPEPVSQDTPVTLSSTSSSVAIPATGSKIAATSFVVTNPTDETLNISVQEISKPTGTITGISARSFTLAPGATRRVGVAGNTKNVDADTYTFEFGILAAGYPGTYPTFSLVFYRQ